MTTNFYAPPSAFRGNRVVLPDDETHHARAVLRAEAGDTMTVVDGEGGWHRVRITHCGADQLVGTVTETRRNVGEPAVDVTVGLGLLKKRARFETFAEKAVELGARRLVPLRTARTEPDTLRTDRVRSVMIAALKQCRRSRLPTLASPRSLNDVLDATTAGHRLICHSGTNAPSLTATVRGGQAVESVLVLVGPEGGFSDDEVAAAQSAGGAVVSLGARRLRAETAGIVATHAVTQIVGTAASEGKGT